MRLLLSLPHAFVYDTDITSFKFDNNNSITTSIFKDVFESNKNSWLVSKLLGGVLKQ